MSWWTHTCDVEKMSAMCSFSQSISFLTLKPNSSSSCATNSSACSRSFCIHCDEPIAGAFVRAAAMSVAGGGIAVACLFTLDYSFRKRAPGCPMRRVLANCTLSDAVLMLSSAHEWWAVVVAFVKVDDARVDWGSCTVVLTAESGSGSREIGS